MPGLHKIMKLQYKNYYLKEFTVDDINKDYIEWLNNPEINKYLEAKYTVWDHLNATNYVQSFKNNREKYLFGIYTLEDNKYIGNGSISSVNYNTYKNGLNGTRGGQHYNNKEAFIEFMAETETPYSLLGETSGKNVTVDGEDWGSLEGMKTTYNDSLGKHLN